MSDVEEIIIPDHLKDIEPFNLIVVPHPKLREKALPIEKVTPEIQLEIDRLLKTMYVEDGAGLAATQVALMKRMVVMEIEEDNGTKEVHQMINPEIISSSQEQEPFPQGCLSVPGVYAEITRPLEVTFKYLDREGKEHTKMVKGPMAHCVQHEIDHLDGILFIDHLSPLKKKMALQKSIKFSKNNN